MVVVLFPRGPNPSKVLQQLLVLQPEQQLSIFNTLRNHLRERGMLPPAVEEAQWRTTPPQQTKTVHVLLNSANIHSWLWSQEHTPNRPQELPFNKRVWCLLQTKLSLLTHYRLNHKRATRFSWPESLFGKSTSEVFQSTTNMQNKRSKHMVSEHIALQERRFSGVTSLFWFW